MKLTALLSAIGITLAALVTFAATPATGKSKESSNRLLEDRARIEHNLKEENARLTAVTKKLSSKFREPEAKAFAKAQTAWAAWRDAEAEYIAYRYAPTKASSPEVMNLAFDAARTANKIQITERRIKQLEIEVINR